MKSTPTSEYDKEDRAIIKLLEELGSIKSAYPPELLTARRATFLAQVEQLGTVGADEELSPEDQEFVKLLRPLRSVPVEYPPELLAARRSAFLRQMDRPPATSFLDELRASIQRIFSFKRTTPTYPPGGLRRISLALASLMVAVFLGYLFFSRTEQVLRPAPSPAAATPTSTFEAAIFFCKPGDQTPSCAPAGLGPGQDLANPGNGRAQPAVSKDAHYTAAYVNDGRGGASWVSDSPDSWIKIDLGEVRTINTVSLRQGNGGSSQEADPGQFVIAIAVSDVYADGDSSHDYTDYAQVFHSERIGFSGSSSQAETIRAQFPPVEARFVKITFEKAGTAIEEVGVFLVKPPVLAQSPTKPPPDDVTGNTVTPVSTSTLSAMKTETSVPAGTQPPTDPAVAVSTNSPPPLNTLLPLPTNTVPPVVIVTPIPTDPFPLSTVIPSTAVPPVLQPTPASTGTIIVTGSDQTLTFTCNGNDTEIRGHGNTVTLLGSCRSITVTGNGNQVFWESGSPVITNRGSDNIVRQL